MNVKNIVLGLGIVVVFALVLWQGMEAFYPSPQYEDFCSNRGYETVPIKTFDSRYVANCTFSRALQESEQQCYSQQGTPIYEYDDNGCAVSVKECDFCQQEYNDASKKHSQRVFFISLIVAVITVVVGFTILKIEPVGSALIGSSIWAIFWGSVINWRNFSNIWRFLLLMIALVLLIWFAVRLNTKKEKSFWRRLGLKAK